MRIVVAVIRGLAAAAVLAAILATWLETAGRTAINPFNFFGYFTVQSNILFAAALQLSLRRRRGRGAGVAEYVRAATTVYIVLVGLVYATLLAPLGQAGGVPVPWANTVLHIVVPLYAVADWLLVGDRPPLDWRRLWVIVLYPAVWLAVVLIRGATDGWVPYPFLAPSQGYGTVAVYCVVIFVVTLAVGALTWWASRLPGPVRQSTATG